MGDYFGSCRRACVYWVVKLNMTLSCKTDVLITFFGARGKELSVQLFLILFLIGFRITYSKIGSLISRNSFYFNLVEMNYGGLAVNFPLETELLKVFLFLLWLCL